MAKVLLIEDHPVETRKVAIGLRLEGFDVEVAPCAEAAMLVLAKGDVDAALIDLMLPRTNGLDFARRMRAEYPGVRILLTSAYHLSERQLLRADCGAVGFVPKPCRIDELVGFLRRKLASGTGQFKAVAVR